MPHFQFQYDFFLFGLALLPLMLLLFLFAKNKKKKAIKKIGDADLVNQLLANYNASSFLKKFILFTGAMGLLVIALANLRTPSGSDKLTSNGIDVMIALDVSKSMLAQDIKPSRLERAKQLMNRLVDKIGNDRVGIVVFAGKAYMQMPLSADHAAAKMYIESASTESIPTQGTVIGDALKMCYASFNQKEKKYKAVVLISDGEDHDENAIKTAAQMGQEGVMINTIGIGSPEGATIMDEVTGELKKDKDGNTVVTKLNQEELKTIAEKGNGVYQLFSNSDAVVSGIAAQLNSMDKRSVTDDSLLHYKTYFQYLVGLALFFLLVEFFVSETKRKRIMKLKPAFTLLFLFFTVAASAQNEKEAIKKGNTAYKKNDYSAATEEYNTVLKKDPSNATAQYNVGNALYRSKKTDESIAAYDNAIKSLKKPIQKSNAYYNKGVVLQNDKKIAECIEAYKNALKISPNDDDARQNLQKALQQQKQQQQQQKDKKQDQDKDQQKKQDQQPKPQQSKISQKDAEQKLQALQQQEANLQDKLHKVNAASVDKPEKDW
ncbi:MAG: VWA domain-containing protein [Ferruginibacter sp.]